LDRASYFATYQNIDIALDTFPHSGGMTTLDALWMGIPVVTWAGETISARLAAASLAALKRTDFIANSPDSYVNLAVAKASNVDALSLLRATLRS
jgi:protein O-GlcNAc transferase